MGVDANVITAERIKEELSKNKTLEGAVNSGFKMGLTPIIDGNVTIVIVAAILMGAFGPTDGFWAKVFNPIFYWFGPSTAGTDLFLWLHPADQRSAELCLWRLGDPLL